VTTEVGEAATTVVRSITFNDENVVAQLEELQQTYPNADIFVSGEL
jgi:inner membrane protein